MTSALFYSVSDPFKLAPKSHHGTWTHITTELLLTFVALSVDAAMLFFSARLLIDCCEVQCRLMLREVTFIMKHAVDSFLTH